MRRILKLHRSLEEPVTPVTHNFHIITFDTQLHPQPWLELNNRIFSTHPDQGNWAMADLENRMREPWFDPHGFFLCVSEEKIVGFCWTKIHQDLVNKEPIGELYVIGVDATHSGKGIGKTLCIEGLNHLKKRGISDAILYVDSNNYRGKKLYISLGFK